MESISSANLLTYLIIITLLVISPGSDVLLVIGAAIRRGARGGIFTALGISIGTLIWTIMVGLGLVTILKLYPALYNIITAVGILYMIYIGIGEIKAGFKSDNSELIINEVNTIDDSILLIKGFTTNMLNPKVGIFYLTFLPQFVNNGQITFEVALLLGVIHIIIGLIWLTFCSYSIDFFRKMIRNKKTISLLSIFAGVLIILFAIFISWQRFVI